MAPTPTPAAPSPPAALQVTGDLAEPPRGRQGRQGEVPLEPLSWKGLSSLLRPPPQLSGTPGHRATALPSQSPVALGEALGTRFSQLS